MSNASRHVALGCSLIVSLLFSSACGSYSAVDCGDSHCIAISLSGLTAPARLRVHLLDSTLQPLSRFETEAEASGEFTLQIPATTQLRSGGSTESIDRSRVRCVDVRTLEGGMVLGGRATARWDGDSHSVNLGPPRDSISWSEVVLPTQLPISNRIAAADLNGDQVTDLVAGNNQSPGVWVLLSDGKGSFAPPMSYGDKAVEALSVLDIDGDGKTDVIFSEPTSGKPLWALLQKSSGDGTFNPPQPILGTAATGKGITAFSVGNLGSSAQPQRGAALSYDSAAPQLYSISSSLQASMGTGLSMLTATSAVSQVTIRDLNADGESDIAVSLRSTSGANLLIGLKNGGQFPAQATESYTFDSRIASFVLADVNSDGRIDVISTLNQTSTGMGDTRLGILLRSESGAPSQFVLDGFPQQTRSLAVTDLNGDQALDMAVVGYNSPTLELRQGPGDGLFSSKLNLSRTLSLSNQPYQIIAADFNQDCKPDLAIAYESNSKIQVFLTD